MRFFRSKGISDKELAIVLHEVGLDAYRPYEKMGKSKDSWDNFRLQLAHDLNRLLDIRKKRSI